MLHKGMLDMLRSDRKRGDFLYPYYGKYSIAEIPSSILKHYGAPDGRETFPENMLAKLKGNDKVVCILADGLGYEQVDLYNRRIPLLGMLQTRADIYPITSVFPSTTAAALTTLHTGLTPQEHGLPEWFLYFEEVNMIVETLPFKVMRGSEREGLLELGLGPDMLYEGKTLYQKLREAGVVSYAFIFHEYIRGSYTAATLKGARIVPFRNSTDLTDKLVDTLEHERGPAYFFVYWTNIDSVQHTFGPHSREHLDELSAFSDMLTREFLPKLTPSSADKTALILTADHGQLPIDGQDIIYLNKYLELGTKYLWGGTKKSILPTGSPHDVFLFIHPPMLEDVLSFLRSELAGKADVMRTEEAIAQGLFGINEPSEKFLHRIGNVLILPYKHYHVWYAHFPEDAFTLKGMHGGLSEEEMLVPLAMCKLSDLL